MGQITQLGGAALALLTTYYIVKIFQSRLRRHIQMKANKLLPPQHTHTATQFSVSTCTSPTHEKIKNLSFLQGFVDWWKEYGSTFSGLTLGNPTIWTVDAQNLQTVHALNFSHYSVEPMRLDATLPLLGRGIFNTDGPFWEHSRTFVRPTFTRAGVANLPAFEVDFQKFLALLLRDGSSIDLEPLLDRLVCNRFHFEGMRADEIRSWTHQPSSSSVNQWVTSTKARHSKPRNVLILSITR
jgi:cytochrome P450